MLKEPIKIGLIGAGMGFIMSALMNYFVVPMPNTLLSNALGNGISGLMSGFMGGFMGLLGYIKSQNNSYNNFK